MAVDTQIAAVLATFAESPAPESLTVAQNRAVVSALAEFSGSQQPVASVSDIRIPADSHDIPVRIYRPASTDQALAVTLFLHGGGWVTGDLDSQDHIARATANRSGTIVVSVDYRLAPEHPFPAAADDAYAALLWIAEHASTFGGDPQRLALLGESAGGNLAAVVAQETLRRGGPPVTIQVLAYPATDRFDDSPSMYESALGPVLTRSWLEWFWGAYLSSPDLGADPRVSPARADSLHGLAPAVVVTAEHDPLRDQGSHYAARLREAGVQVKHIPVPGAVHGFLSFTRDVDLSREVLDQLGDEIRRAFGTGTQ
ncbi:alpha/beta hydrolase [Mycolicibacterium mengxianglii]|uniref:alpha/beta hydrolase n=1 Tax=Mycolicibacterium mengxianglii TaxID=2736649 RepID=UPI0018EF2159|nr:alpha/beta hydrolase [Mycolicibacterium mengxianglii]